MTDTADHADYVLPATTQLEHLDVHTSYGHTYVLINEPAIAPLGEAKPNTRDLPRAGARAWASTTRASPTSDEALAAQAFGRSGGVDFADAARATAGSSCRCPTRRSPTAASPRRAASAVIDAPGLGVPDHVPNYEVAGEHARAGGALPAGDDLAAGAQLPQLHLRQRQEPARHRGRAAARDRTPATPRARGIATAQTVRVFNDRGEYRVQGRVSSARARPGVVNGLGVWWRKLGLDGTQRQRADAPAAHRHRPRAELLRLPGRGRAGRRRAAR